MSFPSQNGEQIGHHQRSVLFTGGLAEKRTLRLQNRHLRLHQNCPLLHLDRWRRLRVIHPLSHITNNHNVNLQSEARKAIPPRVYSSMRAFLPHRQYPKDRFPRAVIRRRHSTPSLFHQGPHHHISHPSHQVTACRAALQAMLQGRR